jgi:formylmethanofuran dehydrogenase subunit A
VVPAVQFAVGLELLVLARDPWRLVLSTDHPNGGSFLAYPRLIRLLMDRSFRDETLRRLPQGVLEGTALGDGLAREYTLGEIATLTRAGPARLLGLSRKGHLGPGADADLTLYAENADREAMFATPRFVFKGGARVAREGRLLAAPEGRTLHVTPGYDRGIEGFVRDLIGDVGTLSLGDYVIEADELRSSLALPAGEA